MLKTLFLTSALAMTASVGMAAPPAAPPTDANCILVLKLLNKLGDRYKQLKDPEIDEFIREAREYAKSDNASNCFNDAGGVASVLKDVVKFEKEKGVKK